MKKATWLVAVTGNKDKEEDDKKSALAKWERRIKIDERMGEIGISSVHIAVAKGNIPMLKLLSSLGADFRLLGQVAAGEAMQPIHLACKLGKVEVYNYILERDDSP